MKKKKRTVLGNSGSNTRSNINVIRVLIDTMAEIKSQIWQDTNLQIKKLSKLQIE